MCTLPSQGSEGFPGALGELGEKGKKVSEEGQLISGLLKSMCSAVMLLAV